MGFAVDDVGFGRRDRGVAQAELLERLRAQIRYEDIATRGEPHERLMPLGRLQVDAGVALVTQHIQCGTRQLRVNTAPDDTQWISAGDFQADDLGTQITQDLRGVWAHDHGDEVKNADTCQRSRRRHRQQGIGGHTVVGHLHPPGYLIAEPGEP
jgi:hypothetical protein